MGFIINPIALKMYRQGLWQLTWNNFFIHDYGNFLYINEFILQMFNSIKGIRILKKTFLFFNVSFFFHDSKLIIFLGLKFTRRTFLKQKLLKKFSYVYITLTNKLTKTNLSKLKFFSSNKLKERPFKSEKISFRYFLFNFFDFDALNNLKNFFFSYYEKFFSIYNIYYYIQVCFGFLNKNITKFFAKNLEAFEHLYIFNSNLKDFKLRKQFSLFPHYLIERLFRHRNLNFITWIIKKHVSLHLSKLYLNNLAIHLFKIENLKNAKKRLVFRQIFENMFSNIFVGNLNFVKNFLNSVFVKNHQTMFFNLIYLKNKFNLLKHKCLHLYKLTYYVFEALNYLRSHSNSSNFLSNPVTNTLVLFEKLKSFFKHFRSFFEKFKTQTEYYKLYKFLHMYVGYVKAILKLRLSMLHFKNLYLLIKVLAKLISKVYEKDLNYRFFKTITNFLNFRTLDKNFRFKELYTNLITLTYKKKKVAKFKLDLFLDLIVKYLNKKNKKPFEKEGFLLFYLNLKKQLISQENFIYLA